MKSVILLRHTKSDWSNILPDMDRPIREDRKDDARLIAAEIVSKGAPPQHLISSPALRTAQTAKLLCTIWNHPAGEIAFEKKLYDCTAQDIISIIKKQDDKYDRIAIVCHNPAITDFVNLYADIRIDNVPTTGAVLITFDGKRWKEINVPGKLLWFLKPKGLQ